MKFKTSLAATAALAALFALGAGAGAQARTVHGDASTIAAQQAEIEALKAQVQMLADRLDAQEAAQTQTQATAQAAAQKADAAQVAADAQVKTIPTEVQTAVAALPKPKPSWADNTKVGGRVFADVSNIDQKSDGVPQKANGTNFDIKRFYISIDHKFSDVWSANLTTDANYIGADGETQLFIKKAYLQAKLNDALVVRFGSADLPWVPFVEGLYGYRYVENTLIDRTKFGTSADWGVHAFGSFGGGLVNYAVSAVNGNGYKNPSRSQGIDLEGRVNLNYAHFVLGVGGYTGKLGKDVEGVVTYHTANRFDAVAAYTNDRFRAGVEYFKANDWTNVLTPVSDSSEGVGVFGSFRFTPQWSVFGRYDWVKPSQDVTTALKDDYFNFGVSYTPVQNIDVALVYKRDKVDNGFLSTSNGSIGGINDGTYDEIGVFTQYSW